MRGRCIALGLALGVVLGGCRNDLLLGESCSRVEGPRCAEGLVCEDGTVEPRCSLTCLHGADCPEGQRCTTFLSCTHPGGDLLEGEDCAGFVHDCATGLGCDWATCRQFCSLASELRVDRVCPAGQVCVPSSFCEPECEVGVPGACSEGLTCVRWDAGFGETGVCWPGVFNCFDRTGSVVTQRCAEDEVCVDDVCYAADVAPSPLRRYYPPPPID